MQYMLDSVTQSVRHPNTIVIVDIDKLCSYWNEFREMGVENAFSSRNESFRDLVQYQVPIIVPKIDANRVKNGFIIGFENGRHRTSFLKYYGEKEMPMLATKESASVLITQGIARQATDKEIELIEYNTHSEETYHRRQELSRELDRRLEGDPTYNHRLRQGRI